MLIDFVSLMVLPLINLLASGVKIWFASSYSRFQLVLFLSTVYYLILHQKGPLDYLNGLAVLNSRIAVLQKSIERSVKSIFLFTLKRFVFHFAFTWLTLSLFSIEFTYIGSLLAGVVAVLPFIAPLYLVFPACLRLYLGGQLLQSLMLLLMHLYVHLVVDPILLSEIADSHRSFD
jgi:predicted PurR-regulated permease PerM